MKEINVTMYDDLKGYINRERYDVYHLEGIRYLMDDLFIGHYSLGKVFRVTKEIGQDEARALEIIDEKTRKNLSRLLESNLKKLVLPKFKYPQTN